MLKLRSRRQRFFGILTGLAVGAGLYAVASPSVDSVDNKAEEFVHVAVRTKTFIDSASHDPLDLDYSNIGITIGRQTLRQVLSEFGVKSLDEADFIVNVTFKFSTVPFLMKDSTEDKLFAHLDEVLAEKRKEALAMVTAQVNAALSKNPGFALMSAAQQQQVRSTTIASAMKSIDQQLNQVRAQKRGELGHRLDQVEKETAFQEIAVSLGKVIQDGSAIVFVKAGKFHVESGAALNDSNVSQLEDMRTVNSRTQRGSTTMATGAIGGGVVKNLRNDLQIRAEAYLFHDRLPWMSGKDYLGGVASLGQDRYDENRKVMKIDSKLLRALLRSDFGEIYVSVGDFNGERAYQTGGLLKITPRDIVMVDYHRGDRLALKEGISLYYAHRVNDRLSVYAGAEKVRGSYQPSLSARDDDKVDSLEYVVGASATLVERKTSYGKMKLRVTGEIYQLHDQNNSILSSEEGKTQGRIGSDFQLDF